MVAISGNASLGAGHVPPAQRPTTTEVTKSFFSAVDPTGSGSFDKKALSGLADKVSISASAVDAMFSLMDSNADGSVTKQEFNNLLQTLKPQGDNATSIAAQPQGMAPHHGGPPPPKAGGPTATANIDPADLNGDGTVSADEAIAYSLSTSTVVGNTATSAASTETMNKGDELLVSKVMRMISSYALAENTQVTPETSWYG